MGKVSCPINPGTDPTWIKELVPSGINYVMEGEQDQDFTTHVLLGAKTNRNVLLVGPKGTGKTTCIAYLAQQTNNPLQIIQLNGATGIDSFVGKWLLRDGQTYWVDGPLALAIRNGYWLLLDELNMALPEILAVLQPVLDDRRILYMEEKGGDKAEFIKAHPNFRCFAAINPTEDYAGTKEMNRALEDRFSINLELAYPSARKEREILLTNPAIKIDDKPIQSKTGIISRIVQVANELRKLYKDQQFAYEISTRNLIDWAIMCEFVTIKDAYKMTWQNKIDKDERVIANDNINKLFADNESWGTGMALKKAFTRPTKETENIDLESIDMGAGIAQDTLIDTVTIPTETIE